MDRPLISIIIPTTAESERQDSLERAINTVLNQKSAVELIVVANGNRCDNALLKRLSSDVRIRLIRQENGHVSKARFAGLKAAAGEFFGFLDDDDELMENALSLRLAFLLEHPEVDCLVTNGLLVTKEETPLVTDGLAEKIQKNRAISLLESNWFASAAPLFRKATVPQELFDMDLRYFEWTYLFFNLLENNISIEYLHVPTYRIHIGQELSASKTDAYLLSYPDFLRELSTLVSEPQIKQVIRKKYHNALNTVANHYLAKGQRGFAMINHFKCLLNGGWRYIFFTRKLIS